jgi:hypothetical protein
MASEYGAVRPVPIPWSADSAAGATALSIAS